MSGGVNASFVLDMQRKLYRWSNEDPDKAFADLFNLVCDRRILEEAWLSIGAPATAAVGHRAPTG